MDTPKYLSLNNEDKTYVNPLESAKMSF